MLKKLASFSGYSLKGRLLVWVLAIYVMCLSVVLFLIPILDSKLESFNEASIELLRSNPAWRVSVSAVKRIRFWKLPWSAVSCVRTVALSPA